MLLGCAALGLAGTYLFGGSSATFSVSETRDALQEATEDWNFEGSVGPGGWSTSALRKKDEQGRSLRLAASGKRPTEVSELSATTGFTSAGGRLELSGAMRPGDEDKFQIAARGSKQFDVPLPSVPESFAERFPSLEELDSVVLQPSLGVSATRSRAQVDAAVQQQLTKELDVTLRAQLERGYKVDDEARLSLASELGYRLPGGGRVAGALTRRPSGTKQVTATYDFE